MIESPHDIQCTTLKSFDWQDTVRLLQQKEWHFFYLIKKVKFYSLMGPISPCGLLRLMNSTTFSAVINLEEAWPVMVTWAAYLASCARLVSPRFLNSWRAIEGKSVFFSALVRLVRGVVWRLFHKTDHIHCNIHLQTFFKSVSFYGAEKH
jgi:hypothetical protein